MQVYANTTPSHDAPPLRLVAGFWRRILAFAIDAFITGVPCAILGLAFYNFFSISGTAGTLIGFAITLLYFSILESSVARGQTIGQRVTHIQVVNREGSLISLERSLVRSLILLAPFLLSSAVLPIPAQYGLNAAIDWLLLGAETAIVYLYLFNRNSRQSLHDLATNTYVVDAESSGAVGLPSLWTGHWAILGAIAVAAAGLGIGFGNTIARSGPFPELTTIQQAILNSGKAQSVGVSIQKTWNDGNRSTGLVVNVVWRGKLTNSEKDATEIANIVLLSNSDANDRDFIAIIFQEGFKIGFATFSKNRRVIHDPATWIKQAQSFGLR